MNHRTQCKIGVILAILVIALFGFSHISPTGEYVEASAFGPSEAHTDAPGENNCTACHSSFPVNSGDGNLTISGLPANYLPGQVIPLTVTVNDTNALVFGSQTTVIDNTGKSVGTFTPPPGVPETMQLIFGTTTGPLRSYIEHTHDGIIPTQAGTKSWTFTWTAPATRVGKVSFYTASNAASGDGSPANDYIYTTKAATLSGSAISNFDSDTKSDVALWRPSDGNWYLVGSETGVQVTRWGAAGDKIVPGDYDGDGKTDIAVFRPSDGNWYIVKSRGGIDVENWGIAGDIPVQGDYDGDLKTDIAVFRPSIGMWFIKRSSDGAAIGVNWGIGTDKVVPGDYDADGKTDMAVFRPSDGNWYIVGSSSGVKVYNWGIGADRPVPGDYDGDGKTDVAVFRASDGNWYIFGSTSGVEVVNWGIGTDDQVPADYDGDGKTDIAVFRNGTWFILQSSLANTPAVVDWGTAGDVPIAAGYISQQ